MQTGIELEFGDGRYFFFLGLAQIIAIQDRCGGGIGAVYRRLAKGRYMMAGGANVGLPEEADFAIHDIIEPIRQGLIGGGRGEVDGLPVDVGPVIANKLIETYVTGAGRQPLKEAWTVAFAVMAANMHGYEAAADAAKKKAPEERAEDPAPEIRLRPRKAASTTPAPSPTAP